MQRGKLDSILLHILLRDILIFAIIKGNKIYVDMKVLMRKILQISY
jgi:hypothetical protein